MNRHHLTLGDALCVKSAEFWLQLGQPTEALKELRTLSEPARTHPWASKVAQAALQTYAALATYSFCSELLVEP